MNTIFRLAGTGALALTLAASGASAQGNGNNAAPGLGMMAPTGTVKSGAATGSAGAAGAVHGVGGQGTAAPIGWGRGYAPGPWMMGGGYGPGPWARGGWMGPSMMRGEFGPGPGQAGAAATGPWMMGPWTQGGDYCGPSGGFEPARQAELNLTVDQVETRMEAWLSMIGNPHIKLGNVAQKSPDTITANIVTTDNGGLVQRYEINRRTGYVEPAGK